MFTCEGGAHKPSSSGVNIASYRYYKLFDQSESPILVFTHISLPGNPSKFLKIFPLKVLLKFGKIF